MIKVKLADINEFEKSKIEMYFRYRPFSLIKFIKDKIKEIQESCQKAQKLKPFTFS